MKTGAALTRTSRSDALSHRLVLSSDVLIEKRGVISQLKTNVVDAFSLLKVVHSEGQENGQKEAKRIRREELEEDDLRGERERIRAPEEKTDSSFADAMETQSPSHSSHDVEISSGNRSI